MVKPRRAEAGLTPGQGVPLISGALRQYSLDFSTAEGIEKLKRDLDQERAIGFDLLWLGNVLPLSNKPAKERGLARVLDLCHESGFRVIMDIGHTPGWFGNLDAVEERDFVQKNVTFLQERFGAHPAFHAWYVPHEIYAAWGAFGEYIDELFPALVDLCKAADPAKPVTISPFFILDQDKIFGDFRYAPPEEYGAYWTKLIKRAGFDVVMLQDSGEHFSYVTDEQRRPFFSAMRSACQESGARLWGNVETAEFECPSPEEYARRYGRVHHTTVKDAPWRAVPLDRLKGKLEVAAEFCERIVTWGYHERCKLDLGAEGAAWYAAYQQYYNTVSALDTAR